MVKSNVAAYYGPGYWDIIHTQAINVKNSIDEDNFIILLKKKFESFPCKECSTDALRYLRENDIKKYKGIKLDSVSDDKEDRLIGMFNWTVIFHNYVNKKLGKPIMSFDDAYIMYTDDSKCSEGCDVSVQH